MFCDTTLNVCVVEQVRAGEIFGSQAAAILSWQPAGMMTCCVRMCRVRVRVRMCCVVHMRYV
jgi:hypothetical protein